MSREIQLMVAYDFHYAHDNQHGRSVAALGRNTATSEPTPTVDELRSLLSGGGEKP
jgi:hypothetical protein